MKTIYIYIFDTFANWEIGNILEAILWQSKLKEPIYQIKTVSDKREPVKSLSGITVVPDCLLKEIDVANAAALLLPGGAWNVQAQSSVLDLAKSFLDNKKVVGAICGATLALADCGLLNEREHTSNSLEYLQGLSTGYKGEALYKTDIAVKSGNLITACSAGGLLWAKLILEALAAYPTDVIEAWYNYYSTGDARFYNKLIELLK